MSALLWAAEPILIIGFAWLILCARLTWPLLICAAVAIVGVGVVAGLDVWAGANSSLVGNLLIAAGVCCCALYTVLTRRIVANVALFGLDRLPLGAFATQAATSVLDTGI